MARPTNPTLWDDIRRAYRRSSRGGESGRWSAAKAVLSGREYKKRGGGWENTNPPPIQTTRESSG